MIKVLTRSLMPEYGVRFQNGKRKRHFSICRFGNETLVFHRPKFPPRRKTELHWGAPPRPDSFWPWRKITPAAWRRIEPENNKTRGSFYVFKDGDEKRYPPDDFWKAIIDDMS